MDRTASIRIGCAELGTVRHVCAFFAGREEAWRVLAPFVVDGFACNHEAVHVVGAERRSDHLRRLRELGVDTSAVIAAGQLDLRSSDDTYLPDGRFDVERMVASFEAMASEKHGYPLKRIVCEMDWAAECPPVRDELIEFEARVNHVWGRHDDVVICVYDLKKLTGDMVIDIMRTHPMVLIGEILQENPFFVPPDQFLRMRTEEHSGFGAY